MDKPILVQYEDFKQNMANLINNSGIPLFMIEPVLQNYLTEIKVAVQRQYALDKLEYEKSLKKDDE